MNTFWDKYYSKPLDEIPWQNTQADWFKKLVDNKTIKGNTALDLGCGTGKKSIYLAQHARFKKIIGVDISKQAIEYATSNAQTARVENICSFIHHDLEDWSFLKNNESFDFILDWAAIHCMSANKLTEYAKNISSHCKSGSMFLVRSFASHDPKEDYFEVQIDDIKSTVFLLTENKIKKLFYQFDVLMCNTSNLKNKPNNKPNYYFLEFLMKKK